VIFLKSVTADKVDRRLLVMIIIIVIVSLVMIGTILFISAGTLKYWNGWLFLAAVLIPMSAELHYLIRKDPELLKKRMRSKEKIKKQEILINISSLFMGLAAIVPGIDYRYQWSHVPNWLVISAFIIFELGFFMYTAVMKQNSYASRIIEVQEDQKVIDYGLYSIVRHPMYLAIVLTELTMPLILGSYYGLIPIVFCFFVITARIREEEKLLEKDLVGYKDYIKKVKYRLIPYIW
jgi:protein-S-isoprenylcysteine O-methyltransferase Ste14